MDEGIFAAQDKALVDIAKSIKLLSYLSWPEHICDVFLEHWKQKNPRLPEIIHQKPENKDTADKLCALMETVDPKHPIGRQIYLTAQSYATAALMLQHQGTPLFTELSIELYGKPTDRVGELGESHLQAADHFIAHTRSFTNSYSIPPTEYCIPSEQVASELERILTPFFTDHKVRVSIEPNLPAKAAAGAGGIRIRGGTFYSTTDVKQLLEHEAFVHTLTALNGRNQTNLTCLALGAPRTTATQEGLATFSEIITNSMDLSRLMRIALRMRAIQMALEGADFIEVFQYFLLSGQDERESFHSAARVFRGGDVRGHIAFTKDLIYLQGLLRVHHFLNKAVEETKIHYAEHLLAGRMALEDVEFLEPHFESGFLNPPLYEPSWLANRSTLAAYLSYYNFFTRTHFAFTQTDDTKIQNQGMGS